jgi:hypothetical protein
MLSMETLDIRALGDGRGGGGHGPGRNRNRTSVKSGHKASEGTLDHWRTCGCCGKIHTRHVPSASTPSSKHIVYSAFWLLI